LQAYGDAHEAELWGEFRAETRSTDGTVKSRWLYGGPPTPDRPRDLGYYVGYRVARAYYRSHSESRRALRDILDVTDSQSFLEASGY
jgi:uncharacterized protein YjaZ